MYPAAINFQIILAMFTHHCTFLYGEFQNAKYTVYRCIAPLIRRDILIGVWVCDYFTHGRWSPLLKLVFRVRRMSSYRKPNFLCAINGVHSHQGYEADVLPISTPSHRRNRRLPRLLLFTAREGRGGREGKFRTPAFRSKVAPLPFPSSFLSSISLRSPPAHPSLPLQSNFLPFFRYLLMGAQPRGITAGKIHTGQFEHIFFYTEVNPSIQCWKGIEKTALNSSQCSYKIDNFATA